MDSGCSTDPVTQVEQRSPSAVNFVIMGNNVKFSEEFMSTARGGSLALFLTSAAFDSVRKAQTRFETGSVAACGSTDVRKENTRTLKRQA